MRKLIATLLSLVLMLSMLVPAAFAEESKSDDVVILYTNDVHTYINGKLSYDMLAALTTELEEKVSYVLLVDAGNHIQSTAYGSMDKGETIIKLMNAAGYDLATLGNHEFDYGMQGCINVREWAEFPYVSCNFYHEEDNVRNENVLDALEWGARAAGYGEDCDGFRMFAGASNVLDYVTEDYMVLANYVQSFVGGVVDAANSPLLAKYPGMLLDYSDLNGSGRIVIEAAE